MAVKTETVFHTPWFEIVALHTDGQAGGEPYYCLLRQDGVIGLIFDDLGRVVLIEQFRPPLGRTTLEMPAGGVESGETPRQAVAREILEETGYACSTLIQGPKCRLTLHRESAVEHFFIGFGARRDPNVTVGEDIRVHLVEREKFLTMVKSQLFEQTVALGALYTVEKAYGIDLLAMDLKLLEAKLLQSTNAGEGLET